MSMSSEKQAAKPWNLAESEQVPGKDLMNTPMPQQEQGHEHEEDHRGGFITLVTEMRRATAQHEGLPVAVEETFIRTASTQHAETRSEPDGSLTRLPRSPSSRGYYERSSDERVIFNTRKEANMRPSVEDAGIEWLLADFNEALRLDGRPDFSILERCPAIYHKELLSLMNVAALAYRALEPEREARRRVSAREKAAT